MKKLISLLFIVLVVFTGCNSQQDKAEKLVKAYLKENLKDPDSYQNVKMDKIEKLSAINLRQMILRDEMQSGMISAELALDSMGIYRKIMIKNKMNPDSIIGYSLIHKFRSKNSFGGYEISQVQYFFNKDLTKIIGTEYIN